MTKILRTRDPCGLFIDKGGEGPVYTGDIPVGELSLSLGSGSSWYGWPATKVITAHGKAGFVCSWYLEEVK